MKKRLQRSVLAIQKSVMIVLLSLVYAIGFGIAHGILVCVKIVKRIILCDDGRAKQSQWEEAFGYSPDMHDGKQQS